MLHDKNIKIVQSTNKTRKSVSRHSRRDSVQLLGTKTPSQAYAQAKNSSKSPTRNKKKATSRDKKKNSAEKDDLYFKRTDKNRENE